MRTLAKVPLRIGDFKDRYYSTSLWHETNAQKDGTIRRETRFTNRLDEWIVSGPHFFVGNPFFKTPNRVCNHNQAYTRLDLTTLPVDYLPRTNYVQACEDYMERIPLTQWGTGATSGYRIGLRAMFGAASERSLITAILPSGIGHIDTVRTIGLRQASDLLRIAHGVLTIVLDFLAKISGKKKAEEKLWGSFPVVPLNPSAAARILGLTCLTQGYANLWNDPDIPRHSLCWSRQDHRLDNAYFDGLYEHWHWHSPLRKDFARWQAQIELDILSHLCHFFQK